MFLFLSLSLLGEPLEGWFIIPDAVLAFPFFMYTLSYLSKKIYVPTAKNHCLH